MTMLQQMEHERRARLEAARLETRHRLRRGLSELAPGREVIVFGSLTRPGRFTESSDIDLALATEPVGLSPYQLSSLLGEQLGRPVDVVLLSECRFAAKIVQEGESWILKD